MVYIGWGTCTGKGAASVMDGNGCAGATLGATTGAATTWASTGTGVVGGLGIAGAISAGGKILGGLAAAGALAAAGTRVSLRFLRVALTACCAARASSARRCFSA